MRCASVVGPSFLRVIAVPVMLALMLQTDGEVFAKAHLDVPVEPAVALEDRYPEHRIPTDHGIVSYAGVVYATRAGYRPLILDLYVPPAENGTDGRRPLIVYVHGGSWISGHTRHSGAFAALVGTACGEVILPEGREAAPESACVPGVVTWYGVFDFRPLLDDAASSAAPVLAQYLGCGHSGCDKQIVAAASPISHVDGADSPFLLVHGEEDRPVDVEQSIAKDQALNAAGVSSELLVIPGFDHSFIGTTAQVTREAGLHALKSSITFIERTLRGDWRRVRCS